MAGSSHIQVRHLMAFVIKDNERCPFGAGKTTDMREGFGDRGEFIAAFLPFLCKSEPSPARLRK